MSVLTKIFVVLLTLCSLALSAAVVVFVNRVEDFKKLYDANSAQIISKTKENGDLQNAIADARNKNQQDLKDAAKHDAEQARIITDLNTQLGTKDTTIAQLNKDKDIAAAQNLGTVNAMKSAQAENAGLVTTVKETRDKYDAIVKQFGDLNVAVTVATNKVQALTKTLTYSEEVIADLQNQLKMAANKGGGGNTPNPGTASASGEVPDIKGAIHSVDLISGKKYATINVGSSSSVTKGMRFSIVNRQTGAFLGYVTIDNVQPDEAIGQVEGPQIDKVQPGLDVRTRL